jgi:hypothetical protein
MLLIGWDSGPEKLCFFPCAPSEVDVTSRGIFEGRLR